MSEKAGSSRDPQREHLCAAAADMFEALVAAEEFIDDCLGSWEYPGDADPEDEALLLKVRAALAKAHGEPSPCEAPQVEREGSREEQP